MLQLPFWEFDQDPERGWRPYYEAGCFERAANLLLAYMQHHPDLAQQQFMLPFHTGQMFALDGQYGRAIEYMARAYTDDPSPIIDWNAFVDANIAFLRHDYDALTEQRRRIALQPVMTEEMNAPKWALGKKMNLDVVDGFIECFGQPYEKAYGDSCREAAQRRNEPR